MIEITNYTPADRNGIRKICFDTGFLGGPLTRIVDNKEFFLDLGTHYFLDVDTTGLIVAKDGNEVAGYLFIEEDKTRHDRALIKYYILRILAEIPRFWNFSTRDVKYYFGVFKAWLHRDYFFSDFEEYPAVLHINIAEKYQGARLGDKLFAAMFQRLKEQNCPGVQLQTTTANEKALRFFKRHGFVELTSRDATFYRSYGRRGIRNIVMGCKIDVQSAAQPL